MNHERVLAQYQQNLSDAQYREILAITALAEREEEVASLKEENRLLQEDSNLMRRALEEAGATVVQNPNSLSEQ